MADDLEADLLGRILYAELPDEEPIMQWWRWPELRPRPVDALRCEHDLLRNKQPTVAVQ
jgi:hypothetical protein